MTLTLILTISGIGLLILLESDTREKSSWMKLGQGIFKALEK